MAKKNKFVNYVSSKIWGMGNQMQFRKHCFPNCLCIFAIFTLTGCGVSKTPSSSDVENQMKILFESCSPIRLTEFQKVNGVASGEDRYTVNAKFRLKIDALTENKKLKDKLVKEHESERENYEKVSTELKSIRAKADEITKQREARGYEKHNDAEDQAMLEQAIQLSKKAEQYADDNFSILNRYHRFDMDLPSTLLSKYNENFREKCKVPQNSTFAWNLLNRMIRDSDAFTSDQEMDFTADIPMIKSDKGWVMQELWRK